MQAKSFFRLRRGIPAIPYGVSQPYPTGYPRHTLWGIPAIPYGVSQPYPTGYPRHTLWGIPAIPRRVSMPHPLAADISSGSGEEKYASGDEKNASGDEKNTPDEGLTQSMLILSPKVWAYLHPKVWAYFHPKDGHTLPPSFVGVQKSTAARFRFFAAPAIFFVINQQISVRLVVRRFGSTVVRWFGGCWPQRAQSPQRIFSLFVFYVCFVAKNGRPSRKWP